MRLTVLGCNGPYPAANAACSGYMLEMGQRKLLLDFGSGALGKLSALTALDDTLDGLVLSHLHADHMSDVLVLQYALAFAMRRGERSRSFALWLPKEPESTARLLQGMPEFELHPMEDCQQGPWRLRFQEVRHPVSAYGVRVEAGDKVLVYTGDTNTCPGLELFAENADLLLADTNVLFADWRQEGPHMSATHGAQLAVAAHARQLILTHFTPGSNVYALLEEARAIFPEAYLAEPGLQRIL